MCQANERYVGVLTDARSFSNGNEYPHSHLLQSLFTGVYKAMLMWKLKLENSRLELVTLREAYVLI